MANCSEPWLRSALQAIWYVLLGAAAATTIYHLLGIASNLQCRKPGGPRINALGSSVNRDNVPP